MRLRDVCLSEPSLLSLFEFEQASGNLVDKKGSVVGTAPGSGATFSEPGLIYDDPTPSIRLNPGIPGSFNFGDVWDFPNLDPHSFELVFKPNAMRTDGQFLLGKGFTGAGGGYWIDSWAQTTPEMYDGGAFRWNRWNSAGTQAQLYTSAAQLRVGEVSHVIFTFDGAKMVCYSGDGDIDELTGVSNNLPNTTENWMLGVFQNSGSGGAGNGGDWTYGLLAVYDQALSPDRVMEHKRAFFNPRKRVPIRHHGRYQIVDDYMRTQGAEGDGRAPEKSYGMWYERSNRFSNSSARDDATGVNATGMGATVTRDTSEFKFGASSFKVDTNGAATNEGIATDPVSIAASDEGLTGACWVKAPNGATMEIIIEDYLGGTLNGSNAVSFTGTGAWQYVWAGRRRNATSTTAVMRVRTRVTTQNINFNVDGINIESEMGFARIWPSPHILTAGSTSYRGTTRLQLYDDDLPNTFYTQQGWIAFRWRHGFDADVVEGENQGFFQRGPVTHRFTVYCNGINRFYMYIAHPSGDSVVGSGPIDQGSGVVQFVKDTMYTGMAGWDPGFIFTSCNGQAYQVSSIANRPTMAQVQTADQDAADIFGSYQWFNMRPDSDVFWMVVGTGIPTDADRVALHALPSDPSPESVRDALSQASSPYLFYQSGDLFANVITKQTAYHTRRISVKR